MAHRTSPGTPAVDVARRPLDTAGMKASAFRLLGPDDGPDALPPAADEVPTLISTLRGHLELLIPEVEAAADRRPEDDIPRFCAHACVGEARRKLAANPRAGHSEAVAYARRLARVVKALCEHSETLGGS
ncbi:DUF6415 family natural product biosynthesis protein [Streptomyces sp. NPDC015171]|uniref:DUF6415 family natural product biosynthesis protein n=1 Tax=Streptomyces sp. NPDC015171 TaxID=3364945 RepID=UPI0036F77368